MSRILEEKFRQRSASTGSLDGMVITRDNELISLRTEADYQLAKAAAMAAVTAEQMDVTAAATTRYRAIGQHLQASSPPQPCCSSSSDESMNQPPIRVGEMSCPRVRSLLETPHC